MIDVIGSLALLFVATLAAMLALTFFYDFRESASWDKETIWDMAGTAIATAVCITCGVIAVMVLTSVLG